MEEKSDLATWSHWGNRGLWEAGSLCGTESHWGVECGMGWSRLLSK